MQFEFQNESGRNKVFDIDMTLGGTGVVVLRHNTPRRCLPCSQSLFLSKTCSLPAAALLKELEQFEVQSTVLVSVGGVACPCGGWVWWVVTWEVGGGIRGVWYIYRPPRWLLIATTGGLRPETGGCLGAGAVVLRFG